MRVPALKSLTLALAVIVSGNCARSDAPGSGPVETSRILVTSERGDKLAPAENVRFKSGAPAGTVISVYPDSLKQIIEGIGTSFTESSGQFR